MRQPNVAPTGVERTFGREEIIVSKTDPKGILTYANGVFVRVSGYTESELLGKPHNLIRHPDMPRCVFRLLWETIAGGDEMFAYVVNLAKDGAHYWVFAHITPTFGPTGSIIGYHSNRRCPARSAIEAVRPLYAELLAEEHRHRDPPAGMEASTMLLQRRLGELGRSYDEFVWGITPVDAGR